MARLKAGLVAEDTENDGPEAAPVRVDKWLWHARFYKTRTLAAKQVSAGKIRVNATKISKPSRLVLPGDVLTFARADQVRVIKIVATGHRRGPAPEAQALYLDLNPPVLIAKTGSGDARQKPGNHSPAPKYDGKGRPGKKERRNLRLSKRSLLD